MNVKHERGDARSPIEPHVRPTLPSILVANGRPSVPPGFPERLAPTLGGHARVIPAIPQPSGGTPAATRCSCFRQKRRSLRAGFDTTSRRVRHDRGPAPFPRTRRRPGTVGVTRRRPPPRRAAAKKAAPNRSNCDPLRHCAARHFCRRVPGTTGARCGRRRLLFALRPVSIIEAA